MKIKKFPQGHEFPIDLYNARVCVFTEANGWTPQLIQRWAFETMDEVIEVEKGDEYSALMWSPKVLTYILFFSKKAGIQSLVHECLHVTAHIMKDIGEISIENQEPWCYLLQYIVGEVSEITNITSNKKSKS